MPKKRFFLSLKLQIFLFCLIVFVPVFFAARYFYQVKTREILVDELKNKLVTITALSADNFPGELIDKLVVSKKTDTADYKQIKNKIIKLKKTYLFIKHCAIIVKKDKNNENAFYLVDNAEKPYDFNRDGVLDHDEGLNLIEDKSNEIRISTEIALMNGFKKPSLSKIIYTDKSGSWIEAFAPVKGTKIKNSAVLNMEMYLSNISTENHKLLDLFEKIMLVCLLVILILFLIAAQTFIFFLKKLKKRIINIRQGSFEKKIPVSFIYGEIGKLIENVNGMSDELQSSFQKGQEDKDQMEEMQDLIELTNQQIKSKNFQLNSTIVTLNSINELVEELISIKQTQELMETLLPQTIKLVEAEKGFIVEYLPEKNCFKVMTAINTRIIEPDMEILPNDSPLLKKIFDTKNYINIDEAGQIKGEEYNTALIFPFLVEKEIKGLLFIMDKIKDEEKEENFFEEADEATVRTLSKLVAAVWESIHLFELGTVDNLSKLYVRRYLEMNLDEEIKKAQRNHYELSLLMIDIDNLQKCNDTYGHFTGDQVIKLVAEQIRESAGEEDIAARYGGEKMVVLVSEKSTDDALSLAEQIREGVEGMEVPVSEGEPLKVTVSIGVAGFPEHGASTDELVKKADEALYKAKREGKNRVELAGE
jgi:diguanylate cyclase (GGDEF)-like protein